MLTAVALLCLGASGCFALFPLDEYGPGAGDGGADETTAPDGGGIDARVDAFVRQEGSVAFVTSTRISAGDMNGLGGADAICQAIARDAGLDASFRAFLGDRQSDVASRLRRDGGRIVTRNGGLLARDLDELFAKGVPSAFVEDERGNAVAYGGSCEDGGAAWTGAQPDGGPISAGLDCSRWDLDGTGAGVAGSLGKTGGAWVSACLRPCGNPASLYCFQQ